MNKIADIFDLVHRASGWSDILLFIGRTGKASTDDPAEVEVATGIDAYHLGFVLVVGGESVARTDIEPT